MKINYFAITWISVLVCFFFSFYALASKPFCEADFDDDKDVDGGDFAIFAVEFNQAECNGDCRSDFDKDGIVDADDLEILSADFGQRQPECTTITYKAYGLNFSPYMDGQDPNLGSLISADQIRQRMQIIAPYTEWIRAFGSTHGLEHTSRIAHEFDLKAAAGAWLGTDLQVNDLEMQNIIDAARNGYVDLAIVGSEVLLRGDLTEAQLINNINQFKNAVPGVPVTTADVYSIMRDHPNVMSACDVILVNYYPYWEGKDVNNAVAYVHALHQEMIVKAGGKEVIVSESGWPSDGNPIGDAVASLENACFYNLNFVSWARAENVKYFIFEAFDESWKANYEGPQGAHWGLWDKDGILKSCMQDIFDDLTVPDNWTCDITTGGSDHLANTIAAYLVPNGYAPPLASGQSTLPAELMENSIAHIEVTHSP